MWYMKGQQVKYANIKSCMLRMWHEMLAEHHLGKECGHEFVVQMKTNEINKQSIIYVEDMVLNGTECRSGMWYRDRKIKVESTKRTSFW